MPLIRGCAIAVLLFCATMSGCVRAAFVPGEFVAYSQETWGGAPAPGNAAQLLLDHFDGQYTAGFEVGVVGGAGFSMIFTSGPALLNYLPGTGVPGPLTADLVDPTSTGSGEFGGLVAALQLDVDFTDAGLIVGSAGIPFGDLILVNLIPQSLFNGLSVRQALAQMNIFLSFDVSDLPPYTYDELYALTWDITRAFEGGTPSQFAQDHLLISRQPVAVPEPATLALLGLGLAGLGFSRRKQ